MRPRPCARCSFVKGEEPPRHRRSGACRFRHGFDNQKELARGADPAEFDDTSNHYSTGATMLCTAFEDPRKLRELAAWYRDYAERAGASWIWERRLRTAECLERQAVMAETRVVAHGS